MFPSPLSLPCGRQGDSAATISFPKLKNRITGEKMPASKSAESPRLRRGRLTADSWVLEAERLNKFALSPLSLPRRRRGDSAATISFPKLKNRITEEKMPASKSAESTRLPAGRQGRLTADSLGRRPGTQRLRP